MRRKETPPKRGLSVRREPLRTLVAPEPVEPLRRQFGVAHRVRDVPMPQVLLDGAGVVAIIRKFVARRVTEHVRMHREWYRASSPAQATIFRTFESVMGPPRSLTNTYGVDG